MKQLQELYACIYVREFPAQALLRLRSELHDQPCVVMEGESPLQNVCALNTKARLIGMRRGMTKVEVETFQNVTVLQRSRQMEEAVRAILLECAGAFSPYIEDRSVNGIFTCVADIAGTEGFFGAPPSLAKRVRERFRSVGIIASVTVSANCNAAMCLARGLGIGTPIQIVPRGHEAKALSSLPVTVLGITEVQEEIFRTWGIRNVASLAALPEKSLISRLGQEAKRLLQLAKGQHPHLFQPIEVPFVLEERAELDFPLDDLESLLFGLSTMLEQLIIRAKSRVFALASITIALHLDGGGTHERPVSSRVPSNDKQLWIKLLHLDLENHPPQAPILAVHLHAEPGEASKVQLGLFSPQLPEPGRLDVTLARIAGLVGDGNVGQAVLDDTRRSEDFHVEAFSIASSEPTLAKTSSPLCLRLLRPSERAGVESRAGLPHQIYFRSQRYAVQEAYGPWLSGGDWWNEAIWGSEQWDVVGKASNQSILVCRLARDFIANEWRVAGLYD
jgi:protein ImuB